MALRARARLASLAAALGLPQLALARWRRREPGWLTVLNYHRVDAPAAAAEFDDGVLDATPDSLDRQLALIGRHFTPVSLADLLSHLDGRPLPGNPVLVTFDDGYRDNHENALPILLRHGIRATFFVATQYVSERRVYWWDRISWTIKHARTRRFTLRYPAELEVDLASGHAAAERALHRIVKSRHGLDLDRFLAELAEAAGAEWTATLERQLADRLVMTWDEVRALRRAGMDIGSHTRTHRPLHLVPEGDRMDELSGSRCEIEREIGEPVLAIAYPVGRTIADQPALHAAVQHAGYRLGFSYDTGRQPLPLKDTLDVHRFSVERSTGNGRFLAGLAFPFLQC